MTIKAAAQDADNNAFDCGTGKIYDTSKDNELCTSSTCTSTGGANDIGKCCKSESSSESGGSGGGQAGPGGHLDVKQEALLQDAVLGNVLGKGGSGHS